MLDTILESTTGESLTLTNTLLILGVSIFLGFVISLVYIKTNKKEGYSKSFSITLIMLPSIISIIILLVGNNVARAFSLAGAFSIIRFRSAPGKPKDISYVFFTLAVGLSAGMGYLLYAAIFTVVLCAVMIIVEAINFGEKDKASFELRITVPENLNYEELFELSYNLVLLNDISQKKFIDELRVRNGNLAIHLITIQEEDKSWTI